MQKVVGSNPISRFQPVRMSKELLRCETGGFERLPVRLEPSEANSRPAFDRPHVSVLACYGDTASSTGSRVAGEHDDVFAAGVDEALDVNVEVFIGVSNDGKALAPAPDARLDRVARIHVLNVRRDEVPR